MKTLLVVDGKKVQEFSHKKNIFFDDEMAQLQQGFSTASKKYFVAIVIVYENQNQPEITIRERKSETNISWSKLDSIIEAIVSDMLVKHPEELICKGLVNDGYHLNSGATNSQSVSINGYSYLPSEFEYISCDRRI